MQAALQAAKDQAALQAHRVHQVRQVHKRGSAEKTKKTRGAKNAVTLKAVDDGYFVAHLLRVTPLSKHYSNLIILISTLIRLY